MISILFLLFMCYSNTDNYTYSILKLDSFNETYFNLNNEILIFEYENQIDNIVDEGSIYFIFDKGNKPSTEIYIYNSYDKIEKDLYNFFNYDYKTSLK